MKIALRPQIPTKPIIFNKLLGKHQEFANNMYDKMKQRKDKNNV